MPKIAQLASTNYDWSAEAFFLPGEKTHLEQMFICTTKHTIPREYSARPGQFEIYTHFALAKSIGDIVANLVPGRNEALLAVAPCSSLQPAFDRLADFSHQGGIAATPSFFSLVPPLKFLSRFPAHQLFCLTFRRPVPKPSTASSPDHPVDDVYETEWVRAPNFETILLLKRLIAKSHGALVAATDLPTLQKIRAQTATLLSGKGKLEFPTYDFRELDNKVQYLHEWSRQNPTLSPEEIATKERDLSRAFDQAGIPAYLASGPAMTAEEEQKWYDYMVGAIKWVRQQELSP